MGVGAALTRVRATAHLPDPVESICALKVAFSQVVTSHCGGETPEVPDKPLRVGGVSVVGYCHGTNAAKIRWSGRPFSTLVRSGHSRLESVPAGAASGPVSRLAPHMAA